MFFNNEALVGWSHLSVHWAIMNVWAAQIGFCASLKKGKKKKENTSWETDMGGVRGEMGGYDKNTRYEIFNKILY